MPERIKAPRFGDDRGNLVVIEAEEHVPFPIRRIFFTYDMPVGVRRGEHAHERIHQAMICVAGSLRLWLEHASGREEMVLNDPSEAVVMEPLVWGEFEALEPGTVCLVLASGPFDEEEYIRDRADFHRRLAAARPAGG